MIKRTKSFWEENENDLDYDYNHCHPVKRRRRREQGTATSVLRVTARSSCESKTGKEVSFPVLEKEKDVQVDGLSSSFLSKGVLFPKHEHRDDFNTNLSSLSSDDDEKQWRRAFYDQHTYIDYEIRQTTSSSSSSSEEESFLNEYNHDDSLPHHVSRFLSHDATSKITATALKPADRIQYLLEAAESLEEGDNTNKPEQQRDGIEYFNILQNKGRQLSRFHNSIRSNCHDVNFTKTKLMRPQSTTFQTSHDEEEALITYVYSI